MHGWAHPNRSEKYPAIIRKQFMPIEYPRASAIRETLRAKLPNLDAGSRGSVVRALIDGGYALNDLSADHMYASGERTLLSPMQAAAASPRRFNEAVGLCRELGFRISASDSKPLDVEALDRAFAGRDVHQRMRARTALFQIGLILP
jgi:hypothetical protein